MVASCATCAVGGGVSISNRFGTFSPFLVVHLYLIGGNQFAFFLGFGNLFQTLLLLNLSLFNASTFGFQFLLWGVAPDVYARHVRAGGVQSGGFCLGGVWYMLIQNEASSRLVFLIGTMSQISLWILGSRGGRSLLGGYGSRR